MGPCETMKHVTILAVSSSPRVRRLNNITIRTAALSELMVVAVTSLGYCISRRSTEHCIQLSTVPVPAPAPYTRYVTASVVAQV